MRSIVSFTAVLGTASVLHGHSIFLQVSYHSSRLVHVQWIRNYNISTWGGASFIYTWRQQWPICVVVWRSCSTWLKFTSPVQSNCCQKLLLLLLSPLFQFLKNCHGGFSYVRLVAVWGKEVGENTFFKIRFLHENTHSFCQVKRRSVKLSLLQWFTWFFLMSSDPTMNQSCKQLSPSHSSMPQSSIVGE